MPSLIDYSDLIPGQEKEVQVKPKRTGSGLGIDYSDLIPERKPEAAPVAVAEPPKQTEAEPESIKMDRPPVVGSVGGVPVFGSPSMPQRNAVKDLVVEGKKGVDVGLIDLWAMAYDKLAQFARAPHNNNPYFMPPQDERIQASNKKVQGSKDQISDKLQTKAEQIHSMTEYPDLQRNPEVGLAGWLGFTAGSSGVPMVGAAGITAATGSPLLGAGFMGTVEGYGGYTEAKERLLATGMNEEEAEAKARIVETLVAPINTGLEALSLGKGMQLGKDIVDKMRGRAVAKGISKVASGEGAKLSMKQIAETAATETITEMLQEQAPMWTPMAFGAEAPENPGGRTLEAGAGGLLLGSGVNVMAGAVNAMGQDSKPSDGAPSPVKQSRDGDWHVYEFEQEAHAEAMAGDMVKRAQEMGIQNAKVERNGNVVRIQAPDSKMPADQVEAREKERQEKTSSDRKKLVQDHVRMYRKWEQMEPGPEQQKVDQQIHDTIKQINAMDGIDDPLDGRGFKPPEQAHLEGIEAQRRGEAQKQAVYKTAEKKAWEGHKAAQQAARQEEPITPEPAPVAAQEPQGKPPKVKARIMTQGMYQTLRGLGYSKKKARTMSPGKAMDIIKKANRQDEAMPWEKHGLTFEQAHDMVRENTEAMDWDKLQEQAEQGDQKAIAKMNRLAQGLNLKSYDDLVARASDDPKAAELLTQGKYLENMPNMARQLREMAEKAKPMEGSSPSKPAQPPSTTDLPSVEVVKVKRKTPVKNRQAGAKKAAVTRRTEELRKAKQTGQGRKAYLKEMKELRSAVDNDPTVQRHKESLSQRKVEPGLYSIGPKNWADLMDVVGKRGTKGFKQQLLNQFTKDKTEGIPWDIYAENVGFEGGISDFIAEVEAALGDHDSVLKRAGREDPFTAAAIAKYDMRDQGFSNEEIDTVLRGISEAYDADLSEFYYDASNAKSEVVPTEVPNEDGESWDGKSDFLDGLEEETKPEQREGFGTGLFGQTVITEGTGGTQQDMFDLSKPEKPTEDIDGQQTFESKPPPRRGGKNANVAERVQDGDGYGPVLGSEKQADKTSMPQVKAAVPSKEEMGYISEFLKMAAPGSVSDVARVGGATVRKRLAEMARKDSQAQELLKKARKAFTHMSNEDALEFIDRLEHGKQQLSPQLDEIAKQFRELLDQRREAIHSMGKDYLRSFYENYFPHMWKDTKKAVSAIQSIMGRRKLEGPKSFLKKRTIVTVKDGIERGLELHSDNPVDIILLKLHEMDRFIMAQNVIKDLKARGLAKFVFQGGQAPDGYAKIDDPAFTVFGPPEIEVGESYDPVMVNGLMDVARSLGIDTKRFAKLRGRAEGYAHGYHGMKDGGKVRTKFASPVSVLAHEIGHVLGFRYELFNTIRNPGRFDTKKAAREHRVKIDKQWRALADSRYGADHGKDTAPSFKKYVRERVEKEAVALEALIHAPEQFKKLAPDLYNEYTGYLNKFAELRPLLDVKPSVELQGGKAHVPVPGLRIMGNYYAPQEVARLLNNYLSPGIRNSKNKLIADGYNLMRGVGNVLNQAQLAFSGFHALNVTTDIFASSLGLAIKKIGTPGLRMEGLHDVATWVAAPVQVVRAGRRIKKAYNQQLDTIEDESLRNMVELVIQAGGRDRMDPFYYNHAVKSLSDTMRKIRMGTSKQKLGGVFKLPFNLFGAGLELAAKPLMEWYVPIGKLGLFSRLAEYEMKRLQRGDIDNDQFIMQLSSVWDSVDNRMGQLAYDNLFWDKTLKDLSMLAVRSVGWNLGSWREYGGTAVDVLNTKQRLTRGEEILSHRMSYSIGAVMTYGVLGASIMYILTGEGPEELKDYFFPKTGRKNPDGSNERINLPTYAKDWYAYALQPGKTVSHKIHPMWGLLGDLIANKDYFSTQVRNPKDPLSQQMFDVATHVGKEFLPLSARNFMKMSRTAPDSKMKNAFVSVTGITSAPGYISRTPAQKLMYRMIVENIPDKTRSKKDRERSVYRKEFINRLRRGDSVDYQEAFDVLGKSGLRMATKEAKETPFAASYKRLSARQALEVYQLANKSEREQTKKLLVDKLKRARKITDEMKAIIKEIRNSSAQ